MKFKEYSCIQLSHHKDIPIAIDSQTLVWRLDSYQATGWGADVKHYLLFEKDD